MRLCAFRVNPATVVTRSSMSVACAPVVVVVVVVVVVQTAPATAATAVVPMPQVILPAVYIAATIICAIHGLVNAVRVP